LINHVITYKSTITIQGEVYDKEYTKSHQHKGGYSHTYYMLIKNEE